MQIDRILDLFNLSPLEKKVFEICLEEGLIGATNLAQKTNISRTSIYDILNCLIKKGLIIESQKNNVKIYSVQKPEMIELFIDEKQKKAINAKNALIVLKNKYYLKKNFIKPRLQIYEGQKELRQMMKDMLLYRDITAYIFWPVEKIIKLLGINFYKEFQQKRTERNIKIQVIWPHSNSKIKNKYNFLQNDEKLKRETRIAPKNIDFSLGYAIYSNTVRFISSQKENYGFLIESQEMADMMKKQFEIIWSISRKK